MDCLSPLRDGAPTAARIEGAMKGLTQAWVARAEATGLRPGTKRYLDRQMEFFMGAAHLAELAGVEFDECGAYRLLFGRSPAELLAQDRARMDAWEIAKRLQGISPPLPKPPPGPAPVPTPPPLAGTFRAQPPPWATAGRNFVFKSAVPIQTPARFEPQP